MEAGLFRLLGAFARRFNIGHSIFPFDFGSARAMFEPPRSEEPRIIRGSRQIVNGLGQRHGDAGFSAPKALILSRI